MYLLGHNGFLPPPICPKLPALCCFNSLGGGGLWTEAKQVEHGIAINHEECLPTVAPLLVFESVEFRKRTSFASLFLRGVSRLMRKSGLGATEEE